jgi:hypothetical protein
MNTFPKWLCAALSIGFFAGSISFAHADELNDVVNAIANKQMRILSANPACRKIDVDPDSPNVSAFMLKVGKVTNINTAVHCWAVKEPLFTCFSIASQAGTALQFERSGQYTFAALESNPGHTGGDDGHFAQGVSLAEIAPQSMSPGQLMTTVYKQCASYVTIQ